LDIPIEDRGSNAAIVVVKVVEGIKAAPGAVGTIPEKMSEKPFG
jgi:hypothetical protein